MAQKGEKIILIQRQRLRKERTIVPRTDDRAQKMKSMRHPPVYNKGQKTVHSLGIWVFGYLGFCEQSAQTVRKTNEKMNAEQPSSKGRKLESQHSMYGMQFHGKHGHDKQTPVVNLQRRTQAQNLNH